MYPLVLIWALVTSYLCAVEGQKACETPSGGAGNCISLYDCNHLLRLVNKADKSQQDLVTLRRSACGYAGNTPNVCCPTGKPSSSCYTPDGRPGQCIRLSSCTHIAELLKPPVSKDTISFVQNSRCAGTDHYSVCCDVPQDQSTNSNPSSRNACKGSGIASPDSGCCGKQTTLSDRVIGGKITDIDKYPWLALIEYSAGKKNTIRCAGSLISDRYVLTAGHCIAGDVLESGSPRNVRLGEYDTSNEIDHEDCVISQGGGYECTSGAVTIPIADLIPHPDYKPNDRRNKRHDIGLIRLVKSAPYTDFIRPICLPSVNRAESPPAGWQLIAAGWGLVNNTHGSNVKLDVELPFISNVQCQAAYAAIHTKLSLIKGQMCAGGESGKDACRGDSGGPLMWENPNGRKIFECVGIVSFGPYPCAQENVPGVYTNVYEYNSWIRRSIQP